MISFLVRCFHLVILFGEFCWELLVSSIQVTMTVLSPTDKSQPRLVTIPLRVRTDAGIILVANYITLTPGTLSVDVSPDRKTLLVHSLLAGDDSEETRKGIRDGVEARVLKVTG
jgi:multicomponent Na+:H+ antiporter subunit E